MKSLRITFIVIIYLSLLFLIDYLTLVFTGWFLNLKPFQFWMVLLFVMPLIVVGLMTFSQTISTFVLVAVNFSKVMIGVFIMLVTYGGVQHIVEFWQINHPIQYTFRFIVFIFVILSITISIIEGLILCYRAKQI